MLIPTEYHYVVNAFILEVLRLYPPVPLKWVRGGAIATVKR